MAHNILGERFYNRSDKPAWHGIGQNIADATDGAEEALRRLGLYSVEKRALYWLNGEGLQEETGYYGLFREPIAEDLQWRMLGTPVTESYELIDPLTAARLWDDNVRGPDGAPVPVETVGILGKGERLFITTELPTYEVAGDEVKSFLLFDNPLQNNVYVGGYVTGVRTVCQNTLMAGISRASQTFHVSHDKGVTALMGEWLSNVYQHALMTNEVIAEASNLMARKPANDFEVRWIIDGAYPEPKWQQNDPRARKDLAERQKQFEYLVELNERSRELAFALYSGEGTGLQTEATGGTAWGAYCAITELETYRRGSLASAVTGCIKGERAARMRRAWKLAMNADMADEYDPATALKVINQADPEADPEAEPELVPAY
jgi:hypothetical protein